MRSIDWKNWNLMRVIYLLIGGSALISYFYTYEWIVLPLGAFFLYMSIFKLACASGNCEVKEE